MIAVTKEDIIEGFTKKEVKRSVLLYVYYIELFDEDRLMPAQIADLIFKDINIAVPLPMIRRIRKRHNQNIINMLPYASLFPVDANMEKRAEDYYPLPVSVTYEPWECLFNFVYKFTFKPGA